MKGARIDVEKNGHDDFANGVAGAVSLVREKPAMVISWEMVNKIRAVGRAGRFGLGQFALGERQAAQLRRARGY